MVPVESGFARRRVALLLFGILRCGAATADSQEDGHTEFSTPAAAGSVATHEEHKQASAGEVVLPDIASRLDSGSTGSDGDRLADLGVASSQYMEPSAERRLKSVAQSTPTCSSCTPTPEEELEEEEEEEVKDRTLGKVLLALAIGIYVTVACGMFILDKYLTCRRLPNAET
mmetsp:Transcript_133394/g.345302  ORF Transcript_133394/g.345302 Transcript_133394/m.345302 type:complete len:172 (+) Transcript_133394:26-541(+)